MRSLLESVKGRQQQLLLSVIEHYITTAEPVGSKFLAYKKNIGWSEATIRNDLRELEEAGFLTQPHTSAGRIPTEKGYRFFSDHIVSEKNLKADKKIKNLANLLEKSGDYEKDCKFLAKKTSELAKEAVIVSFTLDKIFYTGLSNLFDKPEFAKSEMVINTSRMFEQCETCLGLFINQVDESPKIFVGREHPFGPLFSLVAVRAGKGSEAMFIIFGITRMDYKKNLTIIEEVKNILN